MKRRVMNNAALRHKCSLTMQSVYPTREQILAYRPNAPPQLLTLVLAWKADTWLPHGRTKSNRDKFETIQSLLQRLAVVCNKPVNVDYLPKYPLGPCYVFKETRIILTDPPSIISGLHEFGHHLFGHSELDACGFAVHLFKDAFPKAFAKLDWNGHMLVTH